MRPTFFALAFALLGATTARADCAADFATIMRHAREVGPFRVEGDSSVGALRMATVTEVVPPDAARMSISTAQDKQQAIVIGDEAWGNVKGFWLPLDQNTVRQIKGEAQAGILFSDNAQNVRCLGEKIVDGTTYLAFGFDAAIGNFTVPMTAYVDPASRLPVKAEGSTPSGSDTARFSAIYKLVPDLKIAPPPKP